MGIKLFKDFNQDLVKEFLESISEAKRIKYSKRDNCGPAVIDFLDWIKYDKKLNGFKKIKGVFNTDVPASEKLDFSREVRNIFNKTDLDFDNPNDRELFIQSLPDVNRYKRVLHYWAISNDSKIYDPSGNNQFIKTGLSKDLSPSRYEPISIWDWDSGKLLDIEFDTKEPWTV